VATIRDVAEKANVGVGTVSRVINESPDVSPDTRERVQKAIQELNYTPNLTARRLSLGKTWQIAVVLPYLTLPSYVERLRGVQQALGNTEYYPILYSVGSPDQRDDYLTTLSEKTQVDGLLIISMPLSHKQTQLLIKNEIPTVLIDASSDALPHIVVDDISGGMLATRHLIELGHRRIGFLSDFLDTPFQRSGKDRYSGYRKALQEAGIPYREEFVIEGERGRRNAARLAHRLLTRIPRPSAIFTSSDTHAIGVLDAAAELDIKVPRELSIIGYDGIRDAEYLNLTTISQPLFETGVRGARLLLDLIDNHQLESLCLEMPLKLILRGTTAPPVT
jgi:DNA-binding LacI/PurR family transcriptional regulator